MQDNYIGDIGDYGKYGLLREICSEPVALAVNWYRVSPKKVGKQDDGKFVNYLANPLLYREYDPPLFDTLHKIVKIEEDRKIERIEQAKIFPAVFYSDVLDSNRTLWHSRALAHMQDADIVFLDPDNGLETFKMHLTGKATEKHVKWTELKDYYARGQDVVLYQHRPQMTSKAKCIEDIIHFQKSYLCADCVKLLEFPKYTNRFYFIFLHKNHKSCFDRICNSMSHKWEKDNFCHEIILD